MTFKADLGLTVLHADWFVEDERIRTLGANDWVEEESKAPENEKPGWFERFGRYFKRMASPAATVIGSLPVPVAGAITSSWTLLKTQD